MNTIEYDKCPKCESEEFDTAYHSGVIPFTLFMCMGCAHQWKVRDQGDYMADDDDD